MRRYRKLAAPTLARLTISATLLAGCGASQGTNPASADQHAAAEGHARAVEDDGAALFAKGRAAATAGDSVRAEQYLSLAMEQGYDRREALKLLLRVCLSSSRLRAALDYAKPYLLEHPDDDALRYLVANIHLGLQQEDEARLELELLLRRNPRNSDAHYLLGILDGSDATSAREHFRAYLDVAPRGPRAAEVRSRLAELAIREEASP